MIRNFTDGVYFSIVCDTLKYNPQKLLPEKVLEDIEKRETKFVSEKFKLDNSKFISTW